MKREATVSFVLVVLFSVSMFPLSTFSGAADSHGSPGLLGSQSTVDPTDWWPMFHHDLNHTGYSTSIAPNTNQTLWNYTTGGKVESSPAAVGGFIYVGSYTFPSYSGYVYCLNAATGALVWSYSTGWGVSTSSPAVVDGLVYVGACDNAYFYCLNATSGALVWRYSGGGSWWGSSPAVVGGLVYVGCDNGYVYCLNATSGALVWRFPTGHYVSSSPAVVGGFVYVGSWNKNVYCLDAATGAFVWNYTTGAYVASSPAVVGGFVYVGSADGCVYCLNAATGAFVWSCLTGGGQSSPAVVGGFVYVGSADGCVYCLNAATGAFVWSYTTGGEVRSSPAVACTKKVFVGSFDGCVYCLDASTGALIWKYATGGGVWSSPAVADGTVFVGSDDGKVYAFGPATYDVTIGAWCRTETLIPPVLIRKDNIFNPVWIAPYTFTGLTGTHTFTVPLSDGNIPPDPFIEWNNGVTIENITVSPSCSAQNYTAYYEGHTPPPPYKLTILVPNGGTTNPPPNVYECESGVVVPVTALPWAGWVFDHWVLDGVAVPPGGGLPNPIFVTMNADHTLAAVFNPTLIVGVVGSGSVNLNPARGARNDYPLNTLVTATAIPAYGWVFAYWIYDNATIPTNPYTFGMNAPHTLTAVFYYVPPQPPRGGITVPIDKFGLLAPYVGLASTTMIGAVATAVYVKRIKRRKEKQ